MISPTEICLVKFVPVPVTVLEPAEAAIVPNIFSASSEKADLLFLTKVALDIEEPPPKPITSSESVATVNDVFDVIEVTTPVLDPCTITSPTLSSPSARDEVPVMAVVLFELANVPAVQGSGIVISQSNQISGWGLQFTGSQGNVKLESGTTYPSASFIAVDGDNAIVVVNAAGIAT